MRKGHVKSESSDVTGLISAACTLHHAHYNCFVHKPRLNSVACARITRHHVLEIDSHPPNVCPRSPLPPTTRTAATSRPQAHTQTSAYDMQSCDSSPP